MNNNEISNKLRRVLSIMHHEREKRTQGTNQYLQSLLDPSKTAKFPDSPPSYSFMKQVVLSQDISFETIQDFSEEFRLIMPVNSPIFGILVERYHVPSQTWCHHKILEYSQRITDPSRYLRYRHVSGDLSLVSATLPSGQYALNGILNGVKLAYAPENMATASFDQLLPYSETNSARRMNVSVAEGVSAVYPAKQHAEFVAPLTLSSDLQGYSIQSMVQSHGSTTRFYQSDVDPRFFPNSGQTLFHVSRDPLEQHHDAYLSGFVTTYQCSTLRFQMTCDVGATPLNSVNLVLGMPSIQNGAYVEHIIREGTFNNQVNSSISIIFEVPFTSLGQITSIGIEVSGSLPTLIRFANVRVSQEQPGYSSTSSQVMVISGKGHDHSTSFRLTGRANLEVVPGSSLKVDMPSQGFPDDDVDDRTVARNFMVLLDHEFNYNGIATIKERQLLTEAVMGLDFSRSQMRNFAFLGAVMPLLQAAGRFALANPMKMLQGAAFVNDTINQVRSTQRQRERQNQAALTTPEQRGVNYAMTGGTQSRMTKVQRERMAAKQVLKVEEVPTPSQPLSFPERLEKGIVRRFVALESGTYKPIACQVLVTSADPVGSAFKISVTESSLQTVYVAGYAGAFPAEVTAREAEDLDSNDDGVIRILQYALLFAKRAGVDSLFIKFECANEFQVSDASFSFALEACYFDLPDSHFYSGDSNPALSFLPQIGMSYETMQMKAGLNQPTFFKVDMSTSNAIDIPPESEVVDLGAKFADFGSDMPQFAAMETTAALFNLLAVMGLPPFASTVYIQAARPPMRSVETQSMKFAQPVGSKGPAKLSTGASRPERETQKTHKMDRQQWIETLTAPEAYTIKKVRFAMKDDHAVKALTALRSDEPMKQADAARLVEWFDRIKPDPDVKDPQIKSSWRHYLTWREEVGKQSPEASAQEKSAVLALYRFLPIPGDAKIWHPLKNQELTVNRFLQDNRTRLKPAYEDRYSIGQMRLINRLMSDATLRIFDEEICPMKLVAEKIKPKKAKVQRPARQDQIVEQKLEKTSMLSDNEEDYGEEAGDYLSANEDGEFEQFE